MNHAEASAGLQQLIAFVNSEDLDRSNDDLEDPRAADAFLKQAGFSAGGLTASGLQRLKSARVAIRDIIAPPPHQRDPFDGWQRLSTLSQGVRLALEVLPAGRIEFVAVGHDAADTVIASLMLAIYDALNDGTWARVKGCRLATCRWAFFDSSKNGSGAWCSMAVCGNREKARRRRQKATNSVR